MKSSVEKVYILEDESKDAIKAAGGSLWLHRLTVGSTVPATWITEHVYVTPGHWAYKGVNAASVNMIYDE